MDAEPYALLGQPCLLNRAIWTILRRLTQFENPPEGDSGGFSALLRIEDGGSPQWRAVEATRQNKSRRSFSCTCAILRQGFWISR